MRSYYFKKAFTLIELLVVISIISLLSTIVLSSLRDAREKAIISNIKEQVRQIKNALELYRNEHDAYPPGQMTYSVLINNYLSDYIEYTPISFDGINSFDIASDWQPPVIPYYITPGISLDLQTLSCGSVENLPFALIFFSQPSTEGSPEYFRNHYGPRTYFLHYGATSNEATWSHYGFCL